MSSFFLGEIRMFGGNFAPREWAFCNGQLLSIAQNSALFALLGTTYGGDGVQTFGLPNLQGAIPIGQGTGPNLSTRVIGETVGAGTTVLTVQNLPAHTHSVDAQSGTAVSPTTIPGTTEYLAPTARNQAPVYTSGSADTAMAVSAVTTAGSSQAFSTYAPSLGVNYIIATAGIFPTRN
jgi:microcystin-dependent protein